MRPAEAAVVKECARRLLAGESVRSIARRPERARGALCGRRSVVAADPAPDAPLGPDQRSARAQGRDRRRGGVGGDHQRRGDRPDPGAAREPGAAHKPGGPPLPARAAAALRPLRRAAGCAAPRRAVSAAMRARRGRASPAAATPTSTPTRSSVHGRGRAAAARHAALQKRGRAAPTRGTRRRSVGRQEADAATAQLEELGRGVRERADHDGRMDGRRASRSSSASPHARKQLAKLPARPPWTGRSATGTGCARTGTRSTSASSTRSSPLSSITVVWARHVAATTASTSPGCAGLAALSPSSSATSASARRSASLTGTPWSTQVALDPRSARALASSDPLRPAGRRPTPPLHTRRQPDPLRRGSMSRRRGDASSAVRRSTRSWPAGSPARPRSGAALPAGARRRGRGRRSARGSAAASRDSASAPDPTGSPSRSLIWTKP